MLYSAQWHRVQRNVRMVQLCALQQMQKNINNEIKLQTTNTLLYAGTLCVLLDAGGVRVAQAFSRQHGPRLCGAPQGRAGELSAPCGVAPSPLQ